MAAQNDQSHKNSCFMLKLAFPSISFDLFQNKPLWPVTNPVTATVFSLVQLEFLQPNRQSGFDLATHTAKTKTLQLADHQFNKPVPIDIGIYRYV